MLDRILSLLEYKGTICERLAAEFRFAYELSKNENGRFESDIEAALSYYETAIKNGELTADTLEKTEKLLLPLKSEAKSYRYICPAHAHIDMNWQWSYDETVMTTIDTFKTMLSLLCEYPMFCFSQSQGAVYKIAEEYNPDMLEQIKKYVKQGRWEITASTWVEADKNMPCGESLARHHLYTKNYLSKLFSIPQDRLNIDFEPDTFGHSTNVPEIAAQAGVKYYYHCRGNDNGDILYRWKSPSGAELMVYREPYFYNSFIDSHMCDAAVELANKTGMKTLLKVYGVGDHGGGPSRREIEMLLTMQQWPIYPTISFGTFSDYFAEAEKNRSNLNIYNDEINFICDGCYTSQSRIKDGHSQSQKKLIEADKFTAFAGEFGFKYDYTSAWEKLLFTEFHDILTGSCVIASREHASASHQEVMAKTRAGIRQSLNVICDRINTKDIFSVPLSKSYAGGAGSGNEQTEQSGGLKRLFHLFNSNQSDYKGICKITIWDYEGNTDNIEFYDCHGKKTPSQKSQSGHYWGHDYTDFLVDAGIPAYGYTCVICDSRHDALMPYGYVAEKRRQHEENFILENNFVKAVVDPVSGAITSFYNKKTKKELIDQSSSGAALCFIQEANSKSITEWGSGMSSWFVGRHKLIKPVGGGIEIYPGESGPLRSSIIYNASIENSTVTMEISLDADKPDLDLKLNCDWREFGDVNSGIPSLAFLVPVYYQNKFKYDIPFGVKSRKGMNIDRPANSFVATDEIMLIAEARHGFRTYNNQIVLKLIRSSFDPDPTPETGSHTTAFSLSAISNCDNSTLVKKAAEKYSEIQVVSGKSQPGNLPVTGQFLNISGNCIVSAIKQSVLKDAVCLRIYEVNGKEENVSLALHRNNAKSAYFTDINEHECIKSIEIADGNLSFTVSPYSISTVIIQF